MRMRITGLLTEKLIGGCLVLMLAAPTARSAALPWQDIALAPEDKSAPKSGAQNAEAERGNVKSIVDPAQSDATLPNAPEVAQTTGPISSGQNGNSQPNQDQQQNGAAQPVGTAAAPEVKGTGVSGSRVSGAAIAPAKQRRVRIFLIRVGVIAAACVAVGTVVALTHATPSQPSQ